MQIKNTSTKLLIFLAFFSITAWSTCFILFQNYYVTGKFKKPSEEPITICQEIRGERFCYEEENGLVIIIQALLAIDNPDVDKVLRGHNIRGFGIYKQPIDNILYPRN